MGGPLQGIRVVDFAHWAVGPFCGLLLGALGATVVKVDPPEGDGLATVPPTQRGAGTPYLAVNLYKDNLRLDLKSPEGLDRALELIREADVFIENMSPGTIERLGLGYERVREVNPRIIYASATPYGRTGPLARNAGIDCLIQAFSGFARINGTPERGGEMLRFEGHLDLNTGLLLACAILEALLQRERDGQGRRVDITMLGASLKLQATRIAEFFATGRQPPLRGSADAVTAPHEAFRCQDGRWVFVGVTSEAQWVRLCRALDRPDLAQDPRFATNPDRVRRREELSRLLAEVFASRPFRWWETRLEEQRVPFAPVLDFPALVEHRELGAYLAEVEHPLRGRFYAAPPPLRYSRTPLDPPWTRADPLEPSLSPAEALQRLRKPPAEGTP